MPMTPHVEKHFTVGDTVRDIVIGLAGGPRVPFALAALAGFGAIQAYFSGSAKLRGSAQTTPIGGLAATPAFAIARWLS